MSDVRVKFSGDTKDLERAAKRAQNVLNGLGSRAKSAGKSLSDSFRNALGAARRFGASLSGALAINDIIGEAASFIKKQLTKAWEEPRRAALEAGKVFGNVFSQLLEFDLGDPTKFIVDSRDQIVGLARESAEEVQRLENGLKALEGGFFKQAKTFLSDFFSDEALADASTINSIRQILEEERAVLNTLQGQLGVLEAQSRIRNRLQGRVRPKPSKDPTLGINADGGALSGDFVTIGGVETLREAAQAAKEFQRIKLDNIRADIARSKVADQVTLSLERENEKLLESTLKIQERALASELEIDAATRREAAQQKINASIKTGGLLISELGAEGAAAAADLVLGFQNLQSVLTSVKNVLAGIVRDIAAAAARAAILTAIFPGAAGAAGGFAGLFRGALGLIPFASGGIVTGPTPALIGEAGPEAVIPLDRLGQLQKTQKLEVTAVRISGGDFILGLQEALLDQGNGGLSLNP